MRVVFAILLALSLFSAEGQTISDSSENGDFAISIGIDLLKTESVRPSFSVFSAANYRFMEVSIQSGWDLKSLQDFKDYDKVESKGYWVKPELAVMLPALKEASANTKVIDRGYIRIGVGLGFMKSNTTFEKEFEPLPPYEGFLFSETYDERKIFYTNYAFGIHARLIQKLDVGFGINRINVRREEQGQDKYAKGKMPFDINPLFGINRTGLYLRVGYLL